MWPGRGHRLSLIDKSQTAPNLYSLVDVSAVIICTWGKIVTTRSLLVIIRYKFPLWSEVVRNEPAFCAAGGDVSRAILPRLLKFDPKSESQTWVSEFNVLWGVSEEGGLFIVLWPWGVPVEAECLAHYSLDRSIQLSERHSHMFVEPYYKCQVHFFLCFCGI